MSDPYVEFGAIVQEITEDKDIFRAFMRGAAGEQVETGGGTIPTLATLVAVLTEQNNTATSAATTATEKAQTASSAAASSVTARDQAQGAAQTAAQIAAQVQKINIREVVESRSLEADDSGYILFSQQEEQVDLTMPDYSSLELEAGFNVVLLQTGDGPVRILGEGADGLLNSGDITSGPGAAVSVIKVTNTLSWTSSTEVSA